MSDVPAPRVSRAAWALGLAGLLPQAAAVHLLLWDGSAQRTMNASGAVLALIYGACILSFLGGIWWGLAMRRSQGEAALATLAVLPSLIAAGILCWGTITALMIGTEGGHLRVPLIALGVLILLTPPVDRSLASSGETPDGWWRLRATLSVGLGLLTIVAGLLA